MEFLPLIGIALIFWLLLIRPQAKRNRAVAQMQRELAVDDEVMLTSGVFGTVRALDEDRVGVEVAPGVVLQVARGAVGTVIKPDPSEDPASSELGPSSESEEN